MIGDINLSRKELKDSAVKMLGKLKEKSTKSETLLGKIDYKGLDCFVSASNIETETTYLFRWQSPEKGEHFLHDKYSTSKDGEFYGERYRNYKGESIGSVFNYLKDGYGETHFSIDQDLIRGTIDEITDRLIDGEEVFIEEEKLIRGTLNGDYINEGEFYSTFDNTRTPLNLQLLCGGREGYRTTYSTITQLNSVSDLEALTRIETFEEPKTEFERIGQFFEKLDLKSSNQENRKYCYRLNETKETGYSIYPGDTISPFEAAKQIMDGKSIMIHKSPIKLGPEHDLCATPLTLNTYCSGEDILISSVEDLEKFMKNI